MAAQPSYDIGQDGMTLQGDPLAVKLRAWFDEARDLEMVNRSEMHRDADYVDHDQYTEEERRVIEGRHQHPAAFNEIKPAVEWILGSERRAKTDWRVLPRGPNDAVPAKLKSGVLKYVFDVNKAGMAKSRAFAHAVISGLGWLECGIREQTGQGEPLYVRCEDWRNVWRDPISVEPDLSDCRYLVRVRWLDEDVAFALAPTKRDEIAAEMSSVDRYGDDDLDESDPTYGQYVGALRRMLPLRADASFASRRIVRMAEVWYRVPQTVQTVIDGPMKGTLYLPGKDPVLDQLVGVQAVTLQSSVRMQMYVALFLPRTGRVLSNTPSPYRHNRFPFVPVWAYRRGRDGMPYGIVRGARDPQDATNKAFSRAQWEMAARRMRYEEDSFEDEEETAEMAARPDAMIKIRRGKFGTVEFEDRKSLELATSHMAFAARTVEHIRNISGVTGEQRGDETNAQSGKAVVARQQSGTMVTATLFDNLRDAFQLLGELCLSLVEQFYTDARVFRIAGDKREDWLRINSTREDGTISGEDDIASTTADFIMAEQDWRESMRTAQAEQLMDVLTRMQPDVALKLLDLPVELMDLPNGEEFVRRIRLINGMPDPADTAAVQRSEQAIAAQADEQKQAQQQEQARQAAEIQKLVAQAKELLARADKLRVETAGAALSTAGAALTNPVAATAGDHLMTATTAGA